MNTRCESLEAGQDLLKLYNQWRDLTVAEGEAIQRSAWKQVDLCQGNKFYLQSRILEAREQLITELALMGLSRDSVEDQIRSIVDELIVLETKNGELIADQQGALRREQEQLDRSSRNLRQVQKAYCGARSTVWTSYS